MFKKVTFGVISDRCRQYKIFLFHEKIELELGMSKYGFPAKTYRCATRACSPEIANLGYP